MLAARVLEKGGHRVTQASNGKEVLAAVAEEAFDVLVMDVQMPEMDGFESTAVIREREKTTGGRLPIIAVTAYAMKGDRERCLNLGMDAYISKPLRARELRALVERLGAGDEAKIPGETGSPARPDDVRFDQALARLEGDSEILKEQMEYFLKDSPQLLLDIKTAVSHKDANALFIAAHRLKGLAGGFDAHQLAAEASHLEQMGKTGDLTEARSACQYLDVLLGGLRNAMQQHLAAKQLADG
jgi:CheY-like chemotaxis protein